MKIPVGTLSFVEASDLQTTYAVLSRLSPEWHVLRAAHILVSEALLYANYPEQRERPKVAGRGVTPLRFDTPLQRAARFTAASEALRTHAALRALDATEPSSATEPAEWLAWFDHERKPAYAAWERAMDALEAVGYDGSRHPFNFRPWCEAVVAGKVPK